MEKLEELDKQVLWHPFTQMAEWSPLVIARGEGNFLIDTDGRRYLDGVSSLWCNVERIVGEMYRFTGHLIEHCRCEKERRVRERASKRRPRY